MQIQILPTWKLHFRSEESWLETNSDKSKRINMSRKQKSETNSQWNNFYSVIFLKYYSAVSVCYVPNLNLTEIFHTQDLDSCMNLHIHAIFRAHHILRLSRVWWQIMKFTLYVHIFCKGRDIISVKISFALFCINLWYIL